MASKWEVSNMAYNRNKQNNYNKALNQYGQSIADLMDQWYANYNPISKYYFRSDDPNKEYERFVNDMTNERKNDLTQYMERNFNGIGGSNMWLDNYWGSTADDAMINNFVNSKYDAALEQLDRALKRGTLSQEGYNSALENLNTQKSGAFSSVGAIGQGLMDDYRNDLSEKATGFNSDIDNFTLNMYDSLNPDAFQQNFDNLYNQQKLNFENDFNLMTQDLNPFDVTQLIGDARVGQGVNNTQNDELLGAIEDTEKKKNDKVGLGNKGLF